MATSKTRDKVKGKAEKAKGKVRAAAGAATGNESQRLKGDKDVVKGAATNKKGHLKDLAS
ncbi:MAG TPA: CsbD family protein [Thermoleophilaceae bacterium]